MSRREAEEEKTGKIRPSPSSKAMLYTVRPGDSGAQLPRLHADLSHRQVHAEMASCDQASSLPPSVLDIQLAISNSPQPWHPSYFCLNASLLHSHKATQADPQRNLPSNSIPFALPPVRSIIFDITNNFSSFLEAPIPPLVLACDAIAILSPNLRALRVRRSFAVFLSTNLSSRRHRTTRRRTPRLFFRTPLPHSTSVPSDLKLSLVTG